MNGERMPTRPLPGIPTLPTPGAPTLSERMLRDLLAPQGDFYINPVAAGSDPVIHHPAFELLANGDATFAGDLSAATGTFSGELVAATGTFAGSLSAATGTFAGSLSAATGTFAGSLSAATGTFAGSLSAATGTFAGSLSAATGTFAGSLSAATGTFSGTLSAATGTFAGNLTASSVVFSGTAEIQLNHGTGMIYCEDISLGGGNFDAQIRLRTNGAAAGKIRGSAGSLLVDGTSNLILADSGNNLAFYGGSAVGIQTVTGSRADPEQALADLLAKLDNLNLLSDGTTV